MPVKAGLQLTEFSGEPNLSVCASQIASQFPKCSLGGPTTACLRNACLHDWYLKPCFTEPLLMWARVHNIVVREEKAIT